VSAEQYGELIKQHTEQLAELQKLWLVFIVLMFLGLIFLVTMLAAAAWSVRTVVNRQVAGEAEITRQQLELQGKFSLLIDVLLKTVRRQDDRSQSLQTDSPGGDHGGVAGSGDG
jgi:uncharacterized membrane protein YjgN (DUF898 family)